MFQKFAVMVKVLDCDPNNLPAIDFGIPSLQHVPNRSSTLSKNGRLIMNDLQK